MTRSSRFALRRFHLNKVMDVIMTSAKIKPRCAIRHDSEQLVNRRNGVCGDAMKESYS
ncbi:hypothetical protein [Arsenophonus nasoniae]|uniref:hypothetical protein n=1 Tax=Arsenophonus nasoniae TaxID=638 RepID=UPI003879EC49